MRTKYNKRRFRTVIMIFILLLCMSIGYSYLLTTLNIEGTSNIKANTWDVHWENVSVKSGSVTGDQVPIDAYVMSDTTQVEYSVILKNPGDYYEFTVDAKNSGSLDAMVSIIDTKFYEENGVTQINLPDYLEYSVTYLDGDEIEPNHLLAANTSETMKARLKFKDNLEPSQLPTTDKTIIIRQSITYIQADENSTPPRRFMYSFSNNSNPLSIPESNLTGAYSTPEEVIASSGYPFFLRHKIKNGTAYTSEVGLKYNGNIYYLKGGVDEYGEDETPVFSSNVNTLTNALGTSKCDVYTWDIICHDSSLIIDVRAEGQVSISIGNNNVQTGCIIGIDSNDNDYYSYCGTYFS